MGLWVAAEQVVGVLALLWTTVIPRMMEAKESKVENLIVVATVVAMANCPHWPFQVLEGPWPNSSRPMIQKDPLSSLEEEPSVAMALCPQWLVAEATGFQAWAVEVAVEVVVVNWVVTVPP